MTKRFKKETWFAWAFLLTLFSSGLHDAQAHFLWFETPQRVAPGENVMIKIYYGEYHENQREIRGGRLDERKGTTLQMLSPSGEDLQSLPLEGKTRYFQSTLPVDETGLYDLVATDTTNPVVDWRKFDIGIVRPLFYARSWLLSFQEGGVSERVRMPKAVLDLDILPVTRHLNVGSGTFGPEVGEEVIFRVLFKEKPLIERSKISIYATNGWLWEGRIDSAGIGRFTPLWPGRYVVEVIYLEKNPGEFEGKAYEAIRHRATLSLMARAGE